MLTMPSNYTGIENSVVKESLNSEYMKKREKKIDSDNYVLFLLI